MTISQWKGSAWDKFAFIKAIVFPHTLRYPDCFCMVVATKAHLSSHLHPTLHPVQWNFKALWNSLSKQTMFLYISHLRSTELPHNNTWRETHNKCINPQFWWRDNKRGRTCLSVFPESLNLSCCWKPSQLNAYLFLLSST